jgi:hypothetical protein
MLDVVHVEGSIEVQQKAEEGNGLSVSHRSNAEPGQLAAVAA